MTLGEPLKLDTDFFMKPESVVWRLGYYEVARLSRYSRSLTTVAHRWAETYWAHRGVTIVDRLRLAERLRNDAPLGTYIFEPYSPVKPGGAKSVESIAKPGSFYADFVYAYSLMTSAARSNRVNSRRRGAL